MQKEFEKAVDTELDDDDINDLVETFKASLAGGDKDMMMHVAAEATAGVMMMEAAGDRPPLEMIEGMAMAAAREAVSSDALDVLK